MGLFPGETLNYSDLCYDCIPQNSVLPPENVLARILYEGNETQGKYGKQG